MPTPQAARSEMPVVNWSFAMRTVALVAAGLLPAIIGIARAEDVLRAPDDVRTCLCQQQVIADLNKDVAEQNAFIEGRQRALRALDDGIALRRGAVNVADRAEIEAFKALLAQRDRTA